MSALAEFQQSFSRALLLQDAGFAAGLGTGLRVYQNTAMTGLIDVLRANYPTVERLVGAEWFADVAREYVRESLPTAPSLALYGEDFPEFLSGIDTLCDFRYVPQVAKLDRLWTEAHFAADARLIDATTLAGKSEHALVTTKLCLLPSVRLAWLPHSAVTIWQANRAPAGPAAEMNIADEAEGALLYRPHGVVETLRLDRAEHLFLARLQQGESLGEAVVEVLQQYPDAGVSELLARFIHAGVFAQSPAIGSNDTNSTIEEQS